MSGCQRLLLVRSQRTFDFGCFLPKRLFLFAQLVYFDLNGVTFAIGQSRDSSDEN